MASDSADMRADLRDILSGSRGLARRVRAAQRATWFPLLVLAAVTFGAIPVDRFGSRSQTCRNGVGPGLRVCSVYSTAAFVYWPIALVAAYVLITTFYVRRAAARGVGTRVRPYAIVGAVLALALTAASIWSAHHPELNPHEVLGIQAPANWAGLDNRVLAPACAIGLGLIVLAWIERSTAVLLVAVAYLVVVIVPVDFGWTVAHPSRWVFLPHLVIDGALLLIAGLGFALAQHRSRNT